MCIKVTTHGDNSWLDAGDDAADCRGLPQVRLPPQLQRLPGSEAGSYLRLIDSCITQLKAQGPSRTCNESKEEEEEPVTSLLEGEMLGISRSKSSSSPYSSPAPSPRPLSSGERGERGGPPRSAARRGAASPRSLSIQFFPHLLPALSRQRAAAHLHLLPPGLPLLEEPPSPASSGEPRVFPPATPL